MRLCEVVTIAVFLFFIFCPVETTHMLMGAFVPANGKISQDSTDINNLMSKIRSQHGHGHHSHQHHNQHDHHSHHMDHDMMMPMMKTRTRTRESLRMPKMQHHENNAHHHHHHHHKMMPEIAAGQARQAKLVQGMFQEPHQHQHHQENMQHVHSHDRQHQHGQGNMQHVHNHDHPQMLQPQARKIYFKPVQDALLQEVDPILHNHEPRSYSSNVRQKGENFLENAPPRHTYDRKFLPNKKSSRKVKTDGYENLKEKEPNNLRDMGFNKEVQNAIQAQEVGVPLTILTPDNKTIKVIKKWRTDGIEPENLDPNASQSDLANMQIFQFEIETLKNGRTNVQTVEIDGQDAQEFNYVLKMLDQTQVRDTDKS